MAYLQWRRFNFFEKEILNETSDTLIELAKSCQITCSSSGNGFLILGDSVGLVSLVSRQHTISSFTAYKIAVTHCSSIKRQQQISLAPKVSKTSSSNNFHLVTIGTDNEDLVPILKIWSINEANIATSSNSVKDQQNNQNPQQSEPPTSQTSSQSTSPLAQCIRTIKLCPNSSTALSSLSFHSMVTALDVLADSMIAIGFNDGYCLIMKGELIRDKNLKMKLIQVSPNDSVTNVAFATNIRTVHKQQPTIVSRALGSSPSTESIVKQYVTLFVSTRKEICSYNLSSREQEDDKFHLDAFGCEIGACCLKCEPTKLESIQFIVGRKDAIYFYNIDGRGPCLAYEGQKLFLTWFRNYLVVVTLNDILMNRQQNTNANNQSLNDSIGSASGTVSSILSNPNPNLITIYDIGKKFIAYSCPVPSVSQIVSEWGILYTITADGRIIVFKECDIQTKLEMLFKKNQFSLAIDLAKTQTYSQDVLADMFKQYGDHLYRNGDYDGAINQYCQTLGYLEPSYVIRKFLDLQRIHNLTAYLQEIHKRDLATEDHTTLLINCYVKLKDENKLNEFLRSSDIVFDVDIAIRVLRQAGYYDNAIMLARKHGRYDSYFSILLEDKSDSKTVLDTFDDMLKEDKYDIIGKYLRKYGRMLMSDQPDKTTKLLKQFCLFQMKQISNEIKIKKNADHEDQTSDELDLELEQLEEKSRNEKNEPEKYLHIFLNHPMKMIEFLEFIMNEWKELMKNDQNISVQVPMEISNTLLEMYMHSYKSEIQEDGLAENRNKIMSFLNDPNANYDLKKAMILCQMSNFVPGILFLYERAEMYKQILVHYIGKNDSENVIETCKKYADREPKLWVDALQYFSEIYDGRQKENISFVLEKIEHHQLLPPLLVVETLAKPGKVTLGVARSYLMKWIKTQQEQIDENERLIESYREECHRTRKHIEDIRQKPKVFQATKCTACSHVLELPSIHFMCNHSYHQTCFESYMNENDHDCPFCLQENRKILNEISMFDNVKNVNELFQKELLENRHGDPFDVLARYCSQGLFNPLTIVTDDGLITNLPPQSTE